MLSQHPKPCTLGFLEKHRKFPCFLVLDPVFIPVSLPCVNVFSLIFLFSSADFNFFESHQPQSCVPEITQKNVEISCFPLYPVFSYAPSCTECVPSFSGPDKHRIRCRLLFLLHFECLPSPRQSCVLSSSLMC